MCRAASQASGAEASDLKTLVKQQSAQLDRQEKIINALQSQLEGDKAAASDTSSAHAAGDHEGRDNDSGDGGAERGEEVEPDVVGIEDGGVQMPGGAGSAATSGHGGAEAVVAA